jgi:arsenical pump membrane protein
MAVFSTVNFLIWATAAVSVALMLFRPWNVSEAVWTGLGAGSLCALRLIPLPLAWHAIGEGLDVYLFLTGMMLLSELAKAYGVFDWLANVAVRQAGGSPEKLFALIYGVGAIVTALMSNDATAVVLTPAVLAALKRTKAEPEPYLLTCALIANAASFVLPISNPANLVVFHLGMPPLAKWMAMFALPSLVSILATYALLRWYCRGDLRQRYEFDADKISLSSSGKIALFGILAVACVLLAASARKMDLGLPTCAASLAVAAVLIVRERTSPLLLMREISWGVLPLVAALFVLVEAVKSTGALAGLQVALRSTAHWPLAGAELLAGGAVGLGANLVNNLPLGLVAGATLQAAPAHSALSQAILIGIDLGPNLSITGSLATILWLIAIRREGLHFGGWQFLKAGLIIMPPSLLLAIGADMLMHPR